MLMQFGERARRLFPFFLPGRVVRRGLARFAWVTVGALSAVGLSGCPNAVRPGDSKVDQMGPLPGSHPGVHVRESAVATESAPVTLSTTPAPPKALSAEQFRVVAHPAPGSGAVVSVVLTMPAMAMPPTRIQMHPGGHGVYTGTGAFSMPGTWQAEIRISGKGPLLTKDVTITVK